MIPPSWPLVRRVSKQIEHLPTSPGPPDPPPSKTEVVKNLAICNVASAMMQGQMMRVQRQRRAKYSNEATKITSEGCRFDVKCSSSSPYSVHPKVLHHHGADNRQQFHQRIRNTRI